MIDSAVLDVRTAADVWKVRSLEEADLYALLGRDLAWLVEASGRLSRLEAVQAPASVISSERKCWDDKVAVVKAILATGRVVLTAKGEEAWDRVQKEYCEVAEKVCDEGV